MTAVPAILATRAKADERDCSRGNLRPQLFGYLSRLGDDSLVLGQRLSEWCGHAPAIEIDLSLANIALDLIGQAALFLDLAGEVEGEGRNGDGLAFHRDSLDFKNCLLVEQPNGDFAQTIARQFLFSTMQVGLLKGLNQSADRRIAEIASKAVKETAYHAELSQEWVVRLGDGTEESRRRMIEGLDWLWRFVDEMFEVDAVETPLVEAGIAVDRRALRAGFDARVGGVLKEAGLPPPDHPRPVKGGRDGHHTEHLGQLLAAMQFLPRAYPDASW
jgi:ring-1,2-phenylacetyl-CoA epoxidase subunit PaaC